MGMYGPPRDCKGKEWAKTSLRKCIIEDVVICNTPLSVVALLRALQKDAWFQPRAVLFPNPSQFKSLLRGHLFFSFLRQTPTDTEERS
ncbi:MAG: hypothetical protein QOE55_1404 [Acidobacteriaceae bacterium]|nr:hypothetical protein [Acidobacteriaceae bacterium]